MDNLSRQASIKVWGLECGHHIKHRIHSYANAYLWLLAFPGMRSPVGSIGEGRRLKHEVKDWLESSLDTEHTGENISSQFTETGRTI